MSPRLTAALLSVLASPAAAQQTTSIGVAGGLNFVGGSSSNVSVDVGGTPVTGGDRRGQFVTAFVERGSVSTPTSLRLELFYSRLTSSPNTSSALGRAALRDMTYGATATLAYALTSGTGLRPYTLIGAGMYASTLGTDATLTTTDASDTRRGMGLGVHVGLGLEGRVGRARMFTEWRYQQALHQVRGSAFMPLVVGVKF